YLSASARTGIRAGIQTNGARFVRAYDLPLSRDSLEYGTGTRETQPDLDQPVPAMEGSGEPGSSSTFPCTCNSFRGKLGNSPVEGECGGSASHRNPGGLPDLGNRGQADPRAAARRGPRVS